MYSIVLMMAITTGGEAPDCHRHACDGGGCAGSACHGGGLFGGGLFKRHHCHGAAACSGAAPCSGMAPCGGGVACYGGVPAGCYGGTVVPPMAKPPEPIKMPEPKKGEEIKKPISSFGAPAKLIVSMPADARFTIDNYTSPAKSDTHIVVSGPLGAEETKTYVLKAEVIREGKVQTIEKSVTVRSGEEAKVTLSLSTAVAAR